ncbi:Hypothetical_protein [Hexamita inflata]|uniref:Hypothetical_protein n=1 Tax=Hexamita inflata TaxID=28002 RepID=A0AA86TYD9_9EUKA|nr:Hypothetical protein HINF_LOCUS12918 [Hexamita inflata]
MQLQLGDFALQNFNSAQYLQQFTIQQHPELINNLTQLISSQRKVCSQQSQQVFDQFCTAQHQIQLTETYSQLLESHTSQYEQQLNQLVQLQTDFNSSQAQLSTSLQSLLQKKRLIQFQLSLLEVLPNATLDELVQLKQSIFFKSLPADSLQQFTSRFNQLLLTELQSIDLLKSTAQKIIFLAENALTELNSQIHLQFTQQILKKLLPKYGTQQNEVQNVQNLFQIFSSSIQNLFKSPTSFINILSKTESYRTVVFQMIFNFTKEVQKHFSGFFAPVCIYNNMLVFQLAVQNYVDLIKGVGAVKNDEINALYELTQIKVSLQVYTKYLFELAGQALAQPTIVACTNTLQQLFTFYLQFPLQLKLKCEQKQPNGLFIPYLAADLVNSFQSLQNFILNEIIQVIEGQTSQYKDQKLGKFKFISNVTVQNSDAQNPLFKIHTYKNNFLLYEGFIVEFFRSLQMNNMSKFEVECMEKEFQVGFDSYEIYLAYKEAILEEFEKYTEEVKRVVREFGCV